jgi:hypothetical protein
LVFTELLKEPLAKILVRLRSTVRPPTMTKPAGFAVSESITPPCDGRYTPPRAMERALAVFQ